MRFATAILTAVAAFLVPTTVALDPNNCNTKDKVRNGADFKLVAQKDNPNVASLAKIMKKVTVKQVFEDGNHNMTTDSQGRKVWEAKPDFNDRDTKKWIPQGISGTHDAYEAGTYEGKDGWVVTWHRDDDKSVRVTFVDKETDMYRHALLVYPHAKDDFREVPIHAGGVMWYGNTLWVVDTRNGIRVFDLDNIWQVESGDGVGKKADGKYSAAGYKYVIPQIRWYKWSSPFPFRFSFLSLDRTTTPDTLLVGEYQPASSKDPIRMAKFELEWEKGRRLKTDSKGVAKAVWARCVGIYRMQGAVQADGKVYISRSNGQKNGDMFGWIPGKEAKLNAGFIPRSPEDLSYDKRRGGRIYTLTEAPKVRYILDYKASDVKFS